MNGGMKNIVIIGGGFGGIRVARDLGKHDKFLKSKGYEVLVIDRVRHHLYTPLLYEVASGCMIEKGMRMESELLSGVSFRLDEISKSCCGVGSLQGEIVGVDFNLKKVKLASGTEVPYEYLVIAAGAETDYFGIPGLKQNSHAMKTRADALALRQRIQDFIEAKKRGEEVQIQIMVGGGGATGVEFSAEMAGCFRRLARAGEIKNGDWSLTLVEASPRVLGMLPKRASDITLRRLERLGVKVLRDTCVKRAEEKHVVLAPRPLKAGESPETLVCEFRTEFEKIFEVDVLVWTGGVRASSLSEKAGLPVDRKGRIQTDESLRIHTRPDVFAVGDCAAPVDPQTKNTVPQLAQAALKEGELAAKNIIPHIRREPLEMFGFPSYPTVIPLGAKNSILVMKGFIVNGFLGWLVRQAADLRYFFSVLPFWSAIRVFVTGARLYTRND